MSAECYPVSVLPHVTRLFADYLAMGELPGDAALRRWYSCEPISKGWMTSGTVLYRGRKEGSLDELADALRQQTVSFGAESATLGNIEKLRAGANAVVTGQQVGLFGGPLLTLFKAATAVARAAEATKTTGVEHVPVFWLATEDHDLEEVNQITLLSKHSVETVRLGLTSEGQEVGGLTLGADVDAALEQVGELLGYAPAWHTLRECYTPGATLGESFARWMTRLFSAQGLIVMDASGRKFHTFGKATLRAAIEQAAALEEGLLARTRELEREGYHAQVLVKPGHSLLFLLDETSGRREALLRLGDGSWKAGSRAYAQTELLEILEAEPQRLSPNALLRPVFQDTILPTAAYIGGPAEIAYFAQSAVLYEQILGRVTPVLPRLSGTLIEPAISAVMAKHEVSLKDVFEAGNAETLALRLGARAMPVEAKRRLAAAGTAMDAELTALTGYLGSVDASLGRSANVSASKMRYQMARLRRMAARYEVQKEAGLGKHASAMVRHLFPDGHPQERVIGGIWFMTQGGDGIIDRLVEEAGRVCLGHEAIRVQVQPGASEGR